MRFRRALSTRWRAQRLSAGPRTPCQIAQRPNWLPPSVSRALLEADDGKVGYGGLAGRMMHGSCSTDVFQGNPSQPFFTDDSAPAFRAHLTPEPSRIALLSPWRTSPPTTA